MKKIDERFKQVKIYMIKIIIFFYDLKKLIFKDVKYIAKVLKLFITFRNIKFNFSIKEIYIYFVNLFLKNYNTHLLNIFFNINNLIFEKINFVKIIN